MTRSEEISQLIGQVVAEQGAELVDLDCLGSAARPLLRAYVDIPGGTTADACAELSRKIEARLEAARLVGERYVLEVSSPGLNRPLRTRRDFERLRGKPVLVRRGTDHPHELLGTLEEVGGSTETGEFWILVRSEQAGEAVRVGSPDIVLAKPHVHLGRAGGGGTGTSRARTPRH